jgi:hypothetical protein
LVFRALKELLGGDSVIVLDSHKGLFKAGVSGIVEVVEIAQQVRLSCFDHFVQTPAEECFHHETVIGHVELRANCVLWRY